MKPVKISEIMPRIRVEKKLRAKKAKEKTQFPVVKKEIPKIPTPMQAMELSLVFNSSSEERKQGWCKRYLKNDYYVEARAVIPEPGATPALIREEDLNTLLVCFLLLKHSRVKINKYTFETTPYQITKFLGEDTGGTQYADLKESLSRLTANYITTNFWWDTINSERIVKNEFHFLDSVAEGEQKSLKIGLSPEIVDSLEKGYVKFLTESSLRDILKLRGHAKVLALFLLKLVGPKSRQDLNLQTVLKYLGVGDKYNRLLKKNFNTNVKKQIVPAMKKASKAIGISCAYDKDKQQFHLRRIEKINQTESHEGKLPGGPEAKRVGQDAQEPLQTERKQQVSNKLTNVGIHPEMIAKILKEFDIEEIERQIEWLPHRKSDNPAGILVSAIRSRWIMPAEYERERETRLKTVEW